MLALGIAVGWNDLRMGRRSYHCVVRTCRASFGNIRVHTIYIWGERDPAYLDYQTTKYPCRGIFLAYVSRSHDCGSVFPSSLVSSHQGCLRRQVWYRYAPTRLVSGGRQRLKRHHHREIGYYNGQLYASSIITSIVAGLLTTLTVDTGSGRWIGYQILFSFGLGLGLSQANMAIQATVEKSDVATGVSILFFMQGLGGAVWVSIAQTIFTHSLISHLRTVTNLHTLQVVNSGATNLKDMVPGNMLEEVLVQYNVAISDTFRVAVALACASITGALAVEWKNIKGLKQGGQSGEAERERGNAQRKAESATVEAMELKIVEAGVSGASNVP